MIMPKFPDTVMPTIYHIETGAFQAYSVDAREMLTSYPEVYNLRTSANLSLPQLATNRSACFINCLWSAISTVRT